MREQAVNEDTGEENFKFIAVGAQKKLKVINEATLNDLLRPKE